MEPVGEFLEELERAHELRALNAAFEGAIRKIGLDTFIYVKIEASRLDAVSPQTFGERLVMGTNFPRGWRDRYRSSGYHTRDPIIGACRSRIMPLSWEEIGETEAPAGDMTVIDEAREFGLVRGFTVPIHTPSGARVVISLSSDEPLRDFQAMIAAHRHALHVMALHYHEHMERKARTATAAEIHLSPREIECLQWTAQGKTAWEVSQILGISENTVNFHLKKSMGKLDVHSKTHAVAKAVSLGLAEI